MIVDITQMKNGQGGVIVGIEGGMGFRRKMYSLGLREGMKIEKVSAMMWKGPQTVRFGNIQIALGFGMARRVKVEVKE